MVVPLTLQSLGVVVYLRSSISSSAVVLHLKATFTQAPDVSTGVAETLFWSVVFAFPVFPRAATQGACVDLAVRETGVAKLVSMVAGCEYASGNGSLVLVVVTHLEICNIIMKQYYCNACMGY